MFSMLMFRGSDTGDGAVAVPATDGPLTNEEAPPGSALALLKYLSSRNSAGPFMALLLASRSASSPSGEL